MKETTEYLLLTCKQCGEIYIWPEVASAFDNATEHLEKIKQTIKVPVITYAESANFL
ncbi:MAG: hypothetical protein ABH952_07175 [Candidatus Omnitrophota bacterium]